MIRGATRRLEGIGLPVVAAGVAVGAAVLALAAAPAGLVLVRQALGRAVLWPWLPASLACYLAGHLVRGLRLGWLVRPYSDLSVLAATAAVVAGHTVNNLLPLRAGELVRAEKIAERTALPFAKALGLVVVERSLDLLAILGLLLAAAASSGVPSGWLRVAVALAALAFVAASLALTAAAASPGAALTVASRLSAGLPARLHGRTLRLGAGFIAAAGNALGEPRSAAVLIALSMLAWTLEASAFLMVFPAFALPFDPARAAILMAVTNLALVVPSTPGFIGPFHLACAQALAALGADPARALAYAVTVHAGFYVSITSWGLPMILRDREARSAAAEGADEGEVSSIVGRAPILMMVGIPKAKVRPLRCRRLLAAVVDALLPWADPALSGLSAAEREAIAGDVNGFLENQIRALPRRFQWLFEAGMMGFGLAVGVRHPAGFRAQDGPRRTAIVNRWAFGGWATARKLFRLIRSTALLAFFEHPQVRARIESREPASITAERAAVSR